MTHGHHTSQTQGLWPEEDGSGTTSGGYANRHERAARTDHGKDIKAGPLGQTRAPANAMPSEFGRSGRSEQLESRPQAGAVRALRQRGYGIDNRLDGMRRVALGEFCPEPLQHCARSEPRDIVIIS
jgi:hypothetical protein